MHCYYVENLMRGAEMRHLVAESDRQLGERMHLVARAVAKAPNLRLVGLTGPTCSGKTTAAKKLTDYMETHGHRVHVISIDDFFYNTAFLRDRAAAETGGEGEIDYDSEKAIDVDLLEETVRSLLVGKETRMPRFDFRTGLRSEGALLTPCAGDVFLVEGIQLLYPRVNAILEGDAYQSICICPASSIEVGGQVFLPNEIRLMRRLVRDYRYRSSAPAFTFFLWQSVRANEELNIFPNIHLCGHRIDSTLPYEIGMLKPYLTEILGELPRESRFWKSGRDILKKLEQVEPVPSEYMTKNSLYKEFI